jgi:hypothetical protein
MRRNSQQSPYLGYGTNSHAADVNSATRIQNCLPVAPAASRARFLTVGASKSGPCEKYSAVGSINRAP